MGDWGIDNMAKDDLYAGGLELNFFDPASLVMDNSTVPKEISLNIVRKALSILMMGWPQGDWGALGSWRVFNAVFIERDAELLRYMRLAFQEGFHHIYTQLKDKPLTPAQQRQAEFYLSNCLCILPFADITPFESFEIPQFIDGNWVMVDYKVVPIELTATSGIEKLFINDSDRIFAYGLEPIHQQNADPHLIFMGTTYPAGQGFNMQVHTDLEGFETAGKKIYRTGRHRIAEWIDKQDKKPHVCGVSLGGALSLLTAIDQGNKLSRVDALNPAGLYSPLQKSIEDQWDSFSDDEKPAVYIQKQGRDPVSYFGAWKNDWHVLQVNPPTSKQGPNSVTDHALNYAGLADTDFIAVDTNEDNEERKWRNTFVYTLARSFIYYSCIVPFHYVIRPILQYILNHKIQTMLLLSYVALFPYIPLVGSVILIGLAALLSTLDIVDIFTQIIRTIYGLNKVDSPICHDPELPRNTDLNIYTNTTTEEFSVEDLDVYRRAKQSLLKETKIQSDTPLQQVVSNQSFDEEPMEHGVKVTATKAKIHDIKKTVQLINGRFGLLHAKDEVQQAIEQQHHAYLDGKNQIRTCS